MIATRDLDNRDALVCGRGQHSAFASTGPADRPLGRAGDASTLRFSVEEQERDVKRQVFPKLLLALALLMGCVMGCAESPVSDPTPGDTSDGGLVRVGTSLGEFVLALDPEAAPDTVANFLGYVDAGFYDGADGLGATTFHRVIGNFMIQGGGILTDGARKATRESIEHEGPNGLMNLRGTVAMARTTDPDSATSQFFVNHADNPALDYVSEDEPGYVVFGEVRSGMDTVDAIAAVPTGDEDVPETTVLIEEVARVTD